jgi:hypothetical protein
MNEFVRLSDGERIYGAKSLLQSQVSAINFLKHFREYGRLRKEELVMKIDLKAKIDFALGAITDFARTLPKIQLVEETENEIIFDKEEEHKRKTADSELDEIRRKLMALG